ncbi:MAG: PIN domain-containing protein [Motiliproteus sp.]
MKTQYILIDYENVAVKSLDLLQGENFHVRVFLGPKNNKLSSDLVLAMHALGSRGQYIKLDSGGANALDFHIAYYLGRLAATEPMAFFHVISKDTGYDPLISHLKNQKILCVRSTSIADMPCFASVVQSDSKPATKPVPGPAAKQTTKLKADTLVDKVVENLAKRAAGLPRSEKTLKGVLRNMFGAVYSEKEIDAVYTRLVKKGFVKDEGPRLEYVLV